MKMYLAGNWVTSPQLKVIRSPYDGQEIDSVPDATTDQVEHALVAAQKGAAEMESLTGYERYQILMRAADLLEERKEDFAKTISLEEGKPIWEGRSEVSRMPDLLRLCAFEGAQLRGETLPVDAQVNTRGKFGFTVHMPCGVVVAITPFNYPLLLVLHKVGPALAAGNSVILKPANQTPLTALKLTQVLIDAGLPALGIQCITGAGSRIGKILCSDRRVRKVSFTGSVPVGESIAAMAGVKKMSLELGSNAPLIVLRDADIQKAASVAAVSGFLNAGQVCISTQRIIVQQPVMANFLDALKQEAEKIKVGPPLEEETRLSAMISDQEASRVAEWIQEAVNDGGTLVTGGERQGTVVQPTIVANLNLSSKLFREELFGPAVGVLPAQDLAEAIDLANDSDFGLAAGIFTQDINAAMRFMSQLRTGNVMINWSPLWRADLMPYGGLKMSGIGKEGPRYAIQEMTELKTVVMHQLDV